MSDLISRSDVLDILGNVFATTLNVEVDAAIAAMMCKIKYMPKVESDDTTEAYNKGLEDAWELAKKLYEMKIEQFQEVFGAFETELEVMNYLAPQEALAKFEAYEKEQEKAKQKIMVGDIITLEDGTKGVVMDEDGVDNVVIFTENGCIEAWMNKKYITKTGKHIDIQSVLQQIGG